MTRRRMITMIGLSVASGGLLVACAGAPRLGLPTTSTGLGIGPVPFQMPALQAPVLVNTSPPAVQPAPRAAADATSSLSATDRTGASIQAGTFASGGCEFGH